MISELSSLIANLKVEVRAKEIGSLRPSSWSPWLIEPEDDYAELKGFGPIHRQALEWIEINPFEIKHQGRLIPAKTVDHSLEIQEFLESRVIPFLRTDELFFRIALLYACKAQS